MNKHARAVSNDVGTLAEDARDLVAATADLTGEKIAQARDRLTAALEAAKMKAMEGAKATDRAIRANPYQSVGIALGVGALVGYLFGRRK